MNFEAIKQVSRLNSVSNLHLRTGKLKQKADKHTAEALEGYIRDRGAENTTPRLVQWLAHPDCWLMLQSYKTPEPYGSNPYGGIQVRILDVGQFFFVSFIL